jgi:hypothetical protein
VEQKPPFISLHYSRVTPSREQLLEMFAGDVVAADVLPGAKGFALSYATGHTVTIALVELKWEDPFLTAERS